MRKSILGIHRQNKHSLNPLCKEKLKKYIAATLLHGMITIANSVLLHNT